MRSGSLERRAVLRTCFMLPFANLMSEGIVAGSSTMRWARNGTLDSRPWAMLTRASTWSSAGRSVLKSKCVIESKYDSLPTLAPWKIDLKVSHGSYSPRAAQLISSPSEGARLMSLKYRRSRAPERPPRQNPLSIRFLVCNRPRGRLLDSYWYTQPPQRFRAFQYP